MARGWFGESGRHALAAKGVRTGRKSRRRPPKVGGRSSMAYTCTSSPARAKAYRKGRVIVPGEVAQDPGDMGAGFYADTWRSRSEMHGETCFVITIDESKLLKLENPYNPQGVPKWLRDVLFVDTEKGWVMRTVQLPWKERVQAAKEVRDVVLARGYSGVYTRSAKFGREEHFEYAIFSDDGILSVEEVDRSA